MLRKYFPALVLAFLFGIVGCVALPSFASAQDQKPVAIDGDTLAIGKERIRILGLDTPESYNAACPAEAKLAYEAAGRLQHLINERTVRIEKSGRDKYGRSLAKVFVGKDNVADILVREGLAKAYDGRAKRTWWVAELCKDAKITVPREGYLR